MKKVVMLDYKEGNFVQKGNPVKNEQGKVDVNMSISPSLSWNYESDEVAIRIETRVQANGEDVIEYDMMQKFGVEDLKTSFVNLDAPETSPELLRVADLAVGFYRGAFSTRLRESKWDKLFFPLLDSKEFLENCKKVAPGA